MYDLSCSVCRVEYKSKRPDRLYCSNTCAGRAGRRRRGEQLDITKDGRNCGRCGTHFHIIPPSTNARYCSIKCAVTAARELRKIWARRNPERIKGFNSRRQFRDTVMNRLKRRCPALPTACESCGESRILEVAHKPTYKRNGAWRIVSNTQPHMIWVLCPTCHKLLDRGICTQAELGLINA